MAHSGLGPCGRVSLGSPTSLRTGRQRLASDPQPRSGGAHRVDPPGRVDGSGRMPPGRNPAGVGSVDQGGLAESEEAADWKSVSPAVRGSLAVIALPPRDQAFGPPRLTLPPPPPRAGCVGTPSCPSVGSGGIATRGQRRCGWPGGGGAGSRGVEGACPHRRSVRGVPCLHRRPKPSPHPPPPPQSCLADSCGCRPLASQPSFGQDS